MKRLILAVFLSLVLALVFPIPVYAAPVDSPTDYEIDHIEVYRNYIEELDQLWIVTFTITYAVDPTQGTAEQLFLIRLMSGAAEVRSTAPYPYFNEGFAKGIACFYFAASDTDLPTWSGAYQVKIQGNPTWPDGWTDAAMITGKTNAAISLWYDGTTVEATEDTLLVRMRGIAIDLELVWADPTNYDLISASSRGMVLTTVGEGYFTNIVPNIRSQVPDLFSASSQPIAYDPDQNFTQTYANTLAGKLAGTRLDFTNFGYNISGGRLTGLQASSLTFFILVIGFGLILCAGIFRRLNVAAVITLIVLNISLPFGVWMGFVDFTYVGAFYGLEVILGLLSYWAFKT